VTDDRVELRGKRVVLRAFRPDELSTAYEQARASTARVGSLTYERFQLRAARSGRVVDGRLDLAIESEGRLVGSIEARSGEGNYPPGVCEIGIELISEARGSGLGTEAVALLSRHLLATGFDRVQASTHVDNAPMRGALERAGFAFEGTLRAYMPADGSRADYALYAITG
jgi:RimJ/RimL family protein N-acetyltransferase